MAQVKDYYKILGVQENADTDQIKKSFIELANQFSSGSDPKAQELQEAFNVLTSPKKRKLYDDYRNGNSSPSTSQLKSLAQSTTGDLSQAPAKGNGAQGEFASARPQRWSYLTLMSSSNYGTTKFYINGEMDPDLKNGNFSEIVNTLGADGWEMVGISTVGNEQTYVFKRPTNETYVPPKKGPAA